MNETKLVIAEKPSVAQSIAAVLGVKHRKDGYLEGNGYLVSWCVGHLVQLAPPDAYDERYSKWRREDLPILPEQWQFVISPGTKKQFDVLKKLMAEARVTGIVCATDAGREGELIFRLVYEMCGCRKPVERLWISSLEESAIQKGFQELKPGSAYEALYHAALCRAQADWLVGMNASRLLSTAYNHTLSVGRVMTPTLALVTERETAIAAFVPTIFYKVEIDCGGFTAASGQFDEKSFAEDAAIHCNGKDAIVKIVDRHHRKEQPPKLYDLTTLQREANRFFGFTAQQTLDYTQSLYEKKLCTYPRTDSQYLPAGMQENVTAVIAAASSKLDFAAQLPAVHDITQVLDDEKMTDHHAIIPTAGIRSFALDSLPGGEYSLLMLVIARLLCAVGAPHEYAETKLRIACEGRSYSTKGREVKSEGWRAIQKRFHPDATKDEKGIAPLPEVREGDVLHSVSASVKQGKTSPPKHFTEDSLLSAMERAGEMKALDDVEHRGLGTPATRAATIEKLVQSGYIQRTGTQKTKHLLPTQKGIALVTVAPEPLKSPLLTAEWEEKLKEIEHERRSAFDFLADISSMLRSLVSDNLPAENAATLFSSGFKVIGPCLRCNGKVIEKPQGFFCENVACGFALWKNNYFFAAQKKEMTAEFAATLLKDGRVLMRGLKSQKTGKPYDAYLVLDPASPKNARFKIELVKKKEGNHA